jgi:mycothiol S-conjugate amidase
MTHKISAAAFDAAGDPDKYPDAGDPWQPLKLYYDVAWSLARIEAEHQEMLDRGMESPYWEFLKERENWQQREITTRVPVGEYFETRDAALKAHATQIDPDGPFFRTPNDVRRAVWPTEDFELARSVIDTTLPEDDLFAGVREHEESCTGVPGQGVHEPAGVCS